MITKNEEYITTIIDMTHDGAGVAKIDGFAVFVGGAIVGESVRIKIVKVTKRTASIVVIKGEIQCRLSFVGNISARHMRPRLAVTISRYIY